MNVFNKVTLASLKKNKTRTIVTVIGIILSAAMICAVTVSISSLRNFLYENYVYHYGSWHASALDADSDTLDMLTDSDEVESVVYAEQLGYAIIGSSNVNKPYLYLLGAEEGFSDMMPVHLTDGDYPVASDEILLPEHLRENGGVVYGIGDTVPLELGDRMREDYALGQSNPFYKYYENTDETVESSEIFEIRETREFTVVGFYERPDFESYSAPGYTAITIASGSTNASRYDVYFTMENPRNVFDFTTTNSISGHINSDVLMFLGVSEYQGFDILLSGFAAIVIALIMFGSVSLIYNAFAISVSERTKQFGLLSSLGATKKQLRKMVLFEALAVSAIGIPLGILAGVGGIGVTLYIIGKRFLMLGKFTIPMRICVTPFSIIAACVIALVTVLISAWIPSKRATKVSAIEAIKQNADIKIKKEGSKNFRITYKLFGLPGVIAAKHFKRNRKKYRATVVSLFMSIVLFVSASAFSSYLTESVEVSFDTVGYDLMYYDYNAEKAGVSALDMLKRFKEQDGVTDATYFQRYVFSCELPKSAVTDEWMKYYVGASADSDSSVTSLSVYVYFLQDDVFNTILKNNHLNEAMFTRSGDPRAIAYDSFRLFDSKEERFVTGNILSGSTCEVTTSLANAIENYVIVEEFTDENGVEMCRYMNPNNESDTFTLPRSSAYSERTLSAGAVIDSAPYFLDTNANLVLFYPESRISEVLPEDHPTQTDYDYAFISSDHSASYEAIKKIIVEHGLSSEQFYDYEANAETNRNLITIINVFSYGFIALISLIAAANVFNTISTNINLRRREFAMLKSVGMTKKGFNKMMNYECLLYGAKALIYGLPVSIGVTLLIYLTASEAYISGFHLPWASIGIAVFSVFAVVFVTMIYSMHKIKKDNPIDALKNENI